MIVPCFLWQETGFQATKKSCRWISDPNSIISSWSKVPGGQIWIFCWMLTVFIISKSSLDMFHSNQIQILAYCWFTLTRTVRVWICFLSGIWILEEMNYNIFILWKHYGIIWMNNTHSNWDSICPKPWKGSVGCWHCFISWHMRCYHVILFYNNLLFYFILFFMCITFHSFNKNLLKMLYSVLWNWWGLLRSTGKC